MTDKLIQAKLSLVCHANIQARHEQFYFGFGSIGGGKNDVSEMVPTTELVKPLGMVLFVRGTFPRLTFTQPCLLKSKALVPRLILLPLQTKHGTALYIRCHVYNIV
jgi:hypothetical protein